VIPQTLNIFQFGVFFVVWRKYNVTGEMKAEMQRSYDAGISVRVIAGQHNVPPSCCIPTDNYGKTRTKASTVR